MKQDAKIIPAGVRWPGMILQPDSSPISQEQLAVEIKGIYAGLATVETKCIDIDAAQSDSKTPLTQEQWQALIALHRTLLYEHHDFLLATQHPLATEALRQLPTKYSLPARMWKHGIHAFLEVLRKRKPESRDHMLAFISLSYQRMALLYETVPRFTDTWIECLGDLARYRMAIEEEHEREPHSRWGGVAASWYTKGTDRNLGAGRLHRHLAVLERPSLREFACYGRSLGCISVFPSAVDSMRTLCPMRQSSSTAEMQKSPGSSGFQLHHSQRLGSPTERAGGHREGHVCLPELSIRGVVWGIVVWALDWLDKPNMSFYASVSPITTAARRSPEEKHGRTSSLALVDFGLVSTEALLNTPSNAPEANYTQACGNVSVQDACAIRQITARPELPSLNRRPKRWWSKSLKKVQSAAPFLSICALLTPTTASPLPRAGTGAPRSTFDLSGVPLPVPILAGGAALFCRSMKSSAHHRQYVVTMAALSAASAWGWCYLFTMSTAWNDALSVAAAAWIAFWLNLVGACAKTLKTPWFFVVLTVFLGLGAPAVMLTAPATSTVDDRAFDGDTAAGVVYMAGPFALTVATVGFYALQRLAESWLDSRRASTSN